MCVCVWGRWSNQSQKQKKGEKLLVAPVYFAHVSTGSCAKTPTFRHPYKKFTNKIDKFTDSAAVSVPDISAQQSLLSRVENDHRNICTPAVACSVCCASLLLIWEIELWGSIMVSGNWCSWYLTDISYGASGGLAARYGADLMNVQLHKVGNISLKVQRYLLSSADLLLKGCSSFKKYIKAL